jgi:NADH-quinone oxidoreductase subunit F
MNATKTPESTCAVSRTREALADRLGEKNQLMPQDRTLLLQALRLTTLIQAGRGRQTLLDQLLQLAEQLERHQVPMPPALPSSQSDLSPDWQAHLDQRPCPDGSCRKWTVSPCQPGCPAGIDIPSFLALIGKKQYREAVAVIRRDNPFPYICGLVCPAPCEAICLRKTMDDPISIRAMKAVAAREALASGGYPKPTLAPPSGKKAAVIGSGPAGLTAAYFLALQGHQVTVFEAQAVLGGTMFLGIPAYRLPREVIAAEIQAIRDLGVTFFTNQTLGKDFTLEGLRDRGFKAVFLGIGSHCSYKLGVKGEEDSPQVLDALAFLRQVALGGAERPARDVVVVGGGNAAMDAARTCRRLGCRQVTIAYRRSRKEMPAHREEVDQAIAEGVDIKFLTIPQEICYEDGRLKGLFCLEAGLGPADASGRRRPEPRPGSDFLIPAGAVISAIGQTPDLSCLGPLGEDEGVCCRTILVDPRTGQTQEPWLFSGGDAVTGPATVVEAVAGGKQAARAMDAYLRGRSPSVPEIGPQPRAVITPLSTPIELRSRLARPRIAQRQPAESRGSFLPVELGLTLHQADSEARRCLRCDLCIGCGICREVCRQVGPEALAFQEAEGQRLVIENFEHPASRCIGCGVCGLYCPTGAMQVIDQRDVREVNFTGSPLARHPLLPCAACGRFFATPAQRDFIGRRLDLLPLASRPGQICPECSRRLQAQAILGETPHRFS